MAVVIDDIIDQIERTGECIIVNKALRKIPNKIFECVDDVTVLDLSNKYVHMQCIHTVASLTHCLPRLANL